MIAIKAEDRKIAVEWASYSVEQEKKRISFGKTDKEIVDWGGWYFKKSLDEYYIDMSFLRFFRVAEQRREGKIADFLIQMWRIEKKRLDGYLAFAKTCSPQP